REATKYVAASVRPSVPMVENRRRIEVPAATSPLPVTPSACAKIGEVANAASGAARLPSATVRMLRDEERRCTSPPYPHRPYSLSPGRGLGLFHVGALLTGGVT